MRSKPLLALACVLLLCHQHAALAGLVWEGSLASKKAYYQNITNSRYQPLTDVLGIDSRFNPAPSRSAPSRYWWLPGEDLEHGTIDGLASHNKNSDQNYATSVIAPKGATVKVTSLENGAVIEIRIAAKGLDVPGRVIELNETAYIRLFGTNHHKVAPVRLEW